MGGGVEGGEMADTDENILQLVPVRGSVVNIVAGYTAYAKVVGQGGKTGD